MRRPPSRWLSVACLFLACGGDGGEAATETGSGSGTSSSSTSDDSGPGPVLDTLDHFGDEFSSEGGESPAWICADSLSVLGSGPLVWAEPASLTGSVTMLTIDGIEVDAALDTGWPVQFEHWGPCFTVDGGFVGVVLAMGPSVMDDAQSQIRIAVAGGVGEYALDETLTGAVVDEPTVSITCSTIRDGVYFSGPGFSDGQTLAATGTLEVVSVPQADGETLRITLDGSHGDGFCAYTLDVQLTVPDGYFAALAGA